MKNRLKEKLRHGDVTYGDPDDTKHGDHPARACTLERHGTYKKGSRYRC